MSGFFDKFTRKKKSSKDDSSTASSNESWTDFEVSHDIGHDRDNQEQSKQAENTNTAPLEDTSKTTKLPKLVEPQKTKQPLKPPVEAIIAADIDEAINFESDLDPMNEITAQIQSEIQEAKRLKLKQEERSKVLEATNEFRRPEWADDVLKPDE